MFTGIIKELGRVDRMVKGSSLTKIGVSSKIVYQEVRPSESISLNGTCLTLTHKEKGLLFFDVLKSTLKLSNLKRLKTRDCVNLEPSLRVGDGVGGHFVLGHIDGEVRLKRISRLRDYWQLEVDLPPRFRSLIVENGSVALEGISLTIKKVFPRSFTVDIIPFTYINTNLKYKRAGSWLNIEFDYLLKSQISTDRGCR